MAASAEAKLRRVAFDALAAAVEHVESDEVTGATIVDAQRAGWAPLCTEVNRSSFKD